MFQFPNKFEFIKIVNFFRNRIFSPLFTFWGWSIINSRWFSSWSGYSSTVESTKCSDNMRADIMTLTRILEYFPYWWTIYNSRTTGVTRHWNTLYWSASILSLRQHFWNLFYIHTHTQKHTHIHTEHSFKKGI